MSKYFHYQNDALYVEQVPLADIAAQFGTPCYVYSRAALTDSLRQFTDAGCHRKIPNQVLKRRIEREGGRTRPV